MNAKGSLSLIIIFIVMIVILLCGGFYFFNNYIILSNQKLDYLKASHLASLKQSVDQFYNSTTTLPPNETDIINYSGQINILKNEIDSTAYIYKKINEKNYQLCSIFSTISSGSTNKSTTTVDIENFSIHPKGNYCFDLKVSDIPRTVSPPKSESLTSINIQTCTDLPNLPADEGLKITGIYETLDSIFFLSNRPVMANVELFNWDKPSQRKMLNFGEAKSFDVKQFKTFAPKVGYKIIIFGNNDKKVTSDSILFEGSKIRIEDPRCSSSYQHQPSF